MASSLSVLQRADPASLQLDPFPHIVLHDALPERLYDDLVRSRPSPAALAVDETRNNQRWTVGAAQVVSNREIPKLWRDFIAYHASRKFFCEVAELFFEGIHALYPRRYPTLASLKRLRVGVRRRDKFRRFDVLLDAQVAGNTPVRVPTSVRGTHIDLGKKIFSGLFYMREEGDDSKGGDLEICRFRPKYATVEAKSACFDDVYVPDDVVEVVRTVKYGKNTLVLFINSLDALHGVTVRQKTPHGRYFVNLIGEVRPRLYRVVDCRPVYVQDPIPARNFSLPRLSSFLGGLGGRR
ncbi:MAG: hypothetical protein ACR2P8_15740 [Myxococcota bacterium]